MKKVLLKFTVVWGEYEFFSHAVLDNVEKGKEKERVHQYLMGFYGDENTDEKDCVECESYMYNMGQVGVKRISWVDITEEDVKVIEKYGL